MTCWYTTIYEFTVKPSELSRHRMKILTLTLVYNNNNKIDQNSRMKKEHTKVTRTNPRIILFSFKQS